MAPGTEVRVVVVPILKRYWLWHAWKSAPAASTAPKPWQEGESLQEKLKLLVGNVQRWGSRQADQQWHKISTAPEGTFNHRLFRLAQEVLSRVDPNESFLKVLPQQADLLQFSYPSSLPERLVRRRLRLLAAKAQPFHASRLRLWSLALLPQIPLIPLPLPNVTIYFTIWRIISNRSAGQGAAALCEVLERLSDVQRLKLAQQLVALQQQQGLQLRPNTWAAQLAAEADSLQRKLQLEGEDITCSSTGTSSSSTSSSTTAGSTRSASSSSNRQQSTATAAQGQQQQQHPQRKRLPLPVFLADAELDQLVQPHARLSQLLPQAAAQEVAQLYHQPHLLEHYKAACKTCAGPGSTAPY